MTGTLAALEPGGTVRPLFERSVAPLTKHRPVEVMETDSLTAASFFAPASLDWVYLDGAHTEADVAADVAAWQPTSQPSSTVTRSSTPTSRPHSTPRPGSTSPPSPTAAPSSPPSSPR
jgi:hypothetical protein